MKSHQHDNIPAIKTAVTTVQHCSAASRNCANAANIVSMLKVAGSSSPQVLDVPTYTVSPETFRA
jgi:hypothetical protein